MLTLGQSLMLAVLEQAVADLRSVSGNVSRQARAWFLARENGGEHVFSFARICREFGYDPLVVRSHVFGCLMGSSNTINGRRERNRQPEANGRSGHNGHDQCNGRHGRPPRQEV